MLVGSGFHLNPYILKQVGQAHKVFLSSFLQQS